MYFRVNVLTAKIVQSEGQKYGSGRKSAGNEAHYLKYSRNMAIPEPSFGRAGLKNELPGLNSAGQFVPAIGAMAYLPATNAI